MLLMQKEVCVWLDSYATERYRRETVDYRIGQEITNRQQGNGVDLCDVKFVHSLANGSKALTSRHGFLNYKQTLILRFVDVF